MSEARGELLARVRAALAAAVLPAPPPVSAVPQPPAVAGLQELVAAFEREAAAVGCVVHGPISASETLEVVVAILREYHAHELIAWDSAELPVAGLREALADRGFGLLDASLPETRTGRAQRLAHLDGADVGLTGALAGLADTGTCVLNSGPGRPRLAWLLPPVHLALLPVDRLYAGLPEFLAGAREPVRASGNLAFVTGPSRTGDIELVLTRGVHGPGVVHAVLIG